MKHLTRAYTCPYNKNSKRAQNGTCNKKERVKITTTYTELKKVRQANGITQEALAKRAKIALRTYKYYETGKRIPDVNTAMLLAEALECNVPELFPLPTE